MNDEEKEVARGLLCAARAVRAIVYAEVGNLGFGLDYGTLDCIAAEVSSFMLEKIKEAAAKPRGF